MIDELNSNKGEMLFKNNEEADDMIYMGKDYSPIEKDIWRVCIVFYMLLTNDVQPRSKGNFAYISYNYSQLDKLNDCQRDFLKKGIYGTQPISSLLNHTWLQDVELPNPVYKDD